MRKKLSLWPKPKINAKNPDLYALTCLTWQAIQEVNVPPELLAREDTLVRTPFLTAVGGIVIQELDQNRLRYDLTAKIDFFQLDKNEKEMPAMPPENLLKNILVTPDPPVPILLAIVNHPVFAPDGSLQIESGYSAATRRIYSPPPGFKLPKVSDAPGPAEIAEAKGLLLEELMKDFPFTGEPSKAHAIAALLLPFVRAMIEGPTPLHLIHKSHPGTGATLLAEMLCLPSCGLPSVISLRSTRTSLEEPCSPP
jgi:putative DNA primase/helicase